MLFLSDYMHNFTMATDDSMLWVIPRQSETEKENYIRRAGSGQQL